MSILISIFVSGYHGKTMDFAKNSSYHRTTIAHFLNSGKWDDSLLTDTLKRSVIEIIFSEALRTGKPVFCIVLNYAFVLYNKSISKINIVQNIAKELVQFFKFAHL